LVIAALAACTHQETPVAVTQPTAVLGPPKHFRRAYPVALPVLNFPASAAAGAAAAAAAPATSTPGLATAAPIEAGASPAGTTTTTYTTLPAGESGAGAQVATFPPPAIPDAASATTGAAPFVAPTGGPPIPVIPAQPVDANQVAVIDTSFGRLIVELDDFAAPQTCANFRKLVGLGFYDGTIFHRVIPRFIIQGGDPNTRGADRTRYGRGDPGYTLPPEIKLHHDRGAVAMARLPDSVNPQRYSNGSQFYICVAPCPSLDDQYTVFGHVIAGMDVADRISAQPADAHSDPVERIAMKVMLEARDRALRENAATGPQ
jgi:peptidyl-prolyl cis-trans isomerase B (cyclophilin B)